MQRSARSEIAPLPLTPLRAPADACRSANCARQASHVTTDSCVAYHWQVMGYSAQKISSTLALLGDGYSIAAASRESKVSSTTVTRWRDAYSGLTQTQISLSLRLAKESLDCLEEYDDPFFDGSTDAGLEHLSLRSDLVHTLQYLAWYENHVQTVEWLIELTSDGEGIEVDYGTLDEPLTNSYFPPEPEGAMHIHPCVRCSRSIPCRTECNWSLCSSCGTCQSAPLYLECMCWD